MWIKEASLCSALGSLFYRENTVQIKRVNSQSKFHTFPTVEFTLGIHSYMKKYE